MPSEFHNREPPLPFGNPKSRPSYGMDIFWNRPFTVSYAYRPTLPDMTPWISALPYRSPCLSDKIIEKMIVIFDSMYVM